MWSINPASTALLVIDMQNDFVLDGAPLEVPMARRQLPNMQELATGCRAAGIPVIYTRHLLLDGFEVSPLETTYNPRLRTEGLRAGSPGAGIVDELKPNPGEYVVDKHRYDAFHNTTLASVLAGIRGLNVVDTLIISGTLTEVCCESTARSAFMRDFKVVFASDATGARSETAQAATLDAMNTFFGRVLDTASILAEINAPD